MDIDKKNKKLDDQLIVARVRRRLVVAALPAAAPAAASPTAASAATAVSAAAASAASAPAADHTVLAYSAEFSASWQQRRLSVGDAILVVLPSARV